MPRPITWLPRLHEIRRAVANSVRSHYDRRDLEGLFEVQPRSAQKLIELFPVLTVGTSRLVEREALVRFLDGAQEAEDVSGYIEQVRAERTRSSRRKIRWLIRADQPLVSVSSLPEGMSLGRGRLEVSFRSVEELARSLLILARILDEDPEAFVLAYEPEKPRVGNGEKDGVRGMFQELEAMEAAGNALDSVP